MSHRVGTKGQVVIEKRIRDRLGIEPGSLTLQQQVGDQVVIRFFPPERRQSLFGILGDLVERPIPVEDWNEAREEAWRQAVTEKFTRLDSDRDE